MARFPAPYKNDCVADDPIMIRVPVDKMGIGATATGLPGNPNSDNMMIKHVGGALGKGE